MPNLGRIKYAFNIYAPTTVNYDSGENAIGKIKKICTLV